MGQFQAGGTTYYADAADSCCDAEGIERAARRSKQRTVLRLVLAVNASLFVVELIAGLFAHSTALLGDSLDMLGD